MQSNLRNLVSSGAILLVLLLPSFCNASPSISLSITTGVNPVKAGSEVRLKITVTNISQEAVTIANGTTETLYKIEVRDAKGRIVPERKYSRLRTLTAMTLAPGETHEDEIVLSHMFDLSQPGEYSIVVRRNPRNETGTADALSNRLLITVTP